MILYVLTEWGNKLAATVTAVFEWFYEPVALGDLLNSLNHNTGLVSFLLPLLDKVVDFSVVPADLLFKWGVPSILGLIIIKWFIDFVF